MGLSRTVWIVLFFAFAAHHRSPWQHPPEISVVPGHHTLQGRVGGWLELPRPPRDFDAFRFQAGVETSGVHEKVALRLLVPKGNGIAPGDTIRVSGSVSIPRMPRNPGEPDGRRHFKRQGLSGTLSPTEGGLVLLEPGRWWNPSRTALACRHWIGDAITEGIGKDSDEAALLKSMVLGDRTDSPNSLQKVFRESGTMHLFAISGLHIAIFCAIATAVLAVIPLPRPIRVACVIALVFGYALVTGWKPSAVRASVMMAFVLGAIFVGRKAALANSLGAAALFLLALDTDQLLSPGFQLSFGVLFSIFLFSDLFSIPLRRWSEPDPFFPRQLLTAWQRKSFRFGRYLAGLVTVSAAAWIGSLPFLWFHFGAAAPAALFANCALLPLAFMILATAALSASLTAIGLGTLGILANHTNALFAKLAIAAATWFADLPGGYVHLPDLTSPRHPKGTTITVLDIPYGGGATLVESPGGNPWLIDTGRQSSFYPTLRPLLQSRGHRHIDTVLLTHGDSGHSGGAPPLLLDPTFEVESLLAPPLPHRSPSLKEAVSLTESVPLNEGAVIPAGDHASITILHVGQEGSAGIADDRCSVLLFEADEWRILFLGDAGFTSVRSLLSSDLDLHCDVLIRGRHRTDPDGGTSLLQATAPRVVISTNADFPSSERIPRAMLDYASNEEIHFLDQAECGAVQIRIHNGTLTITPFLRSRETIRLGPLTR